MAKRNKPGPMWRVRHGSSIVACVLRGAGAQGLARISKAHGRVQVQACCMSSTAVTFDDIELIFSSRVEKAGKAARGGGGRQERNPCTKQELSSGPGRPGSLACLQVLARRRPCASANHGGRHRPPPLHAHLPHPPPLPRGPTLRARATRASCSRDPVSATQCA